MCWLSWHGLIIWMNDYMLFGPTRSPSKNCKNLSQDFFIVNVEKCQVWCIESKVVVQPTPSKYMPLLLLDMHLSGHQWWEIGKESCTCHWNNEGNNATIWYLHETLQREGLWQRGTETNLACQGSGGGRFDHHTPPDMPGWVCQQAAGVVFCLLCTGKEI